MNLIFWSKNADEEHRDPRVGAWLSELDPGRNDATYWMRFHGDVVDAACFELARRRRESELTVVGVVSSWSRALVPVALVAAATAAILLVQPEIEADEPLMMVEDVLTMGLEEPIPAVFVDEDEDLFRFAAERY